MSDIHVLPLMGHDMPETFPRLRMKARVYHIAEGWHWEHQCAPGWWKNSGFPYMAPEGAQGAALKHLKECCS